MLQRYPGKNTVLHPTPISSQLSLFDEILTQTLSLLRREGRITYRALKRRFDLDDEYLEDLKEEIIEAKYLGRDEGGKVLVWNGDREEEKELRQQEADGHLSQTSGRVAEAERRQLTVMFCDLVGSTALSEKLDPEELREVICAYQRMCAAIIEKYEGHIAQYLGDGVLVYFGYPQAHENDADRAIRAGLEIVQFISDCSLEYGKVSHPLQVRVGIHTGLVVVGEVGCPRRPENLALGDTPNIAARIQGQSRPDEVVISRATYQLVQGLFDCEHRGQPELKGVSTPLSLYKVVGESATHDRFEVRARSGLTPLIGRTHELGLLYERWEQAKTGDGQVVLLSGEPGIGKSRLVQALKDAVAGEPQQQLECRFSPYTQHSALQPVIAHLQRLLHFEKDDTPTVKLRKLEHALAAYDFSLEETVPILATLLSLPRPQETPPVSPQQQKQQTLEILLAWLLKEAERHPVRSVWEDLHWADSTTLEFIQLLVEHAPTARLLVVLTFRPEFQPTWDLHSYCSQVTLNRLGQEPATAIIESVSQGQDLPPEVVAQIIDRADGVPLFVEELTKMVVESGQAEEPANLTIPTIPSTLQDSLRARLDRLGPVHELVQYGATLGREFSYELIREVSGYPEDVLQNGLQELVKAELLYQRGLPPRAFYTFKHALVQETAYQSLLKSKRRQVHRQVAQVLENECAELATTQPELLAHHYLEAQLGEQALLYWQRAADRALQHSANIEAIQHVAQGLDILRHLPDTPEQRSQELNFQLVLGQALMATKGFATPEAEQAYARALTLSREQGTAQQLFSALLGLSTVSLIQGEFEKARGLGEELLVLAEQEQETALLIEAHYILGTTLFHLGELTASRTHLEQGIALYDPRQHHVLAFRYGQDPGVFCRCYMVRILWFLGYPEQALQMSTEALTLAQELNHPLSLALALTFRALVAQLRRERAGVMIYAEQALALSTEHEFAFYRAMGRVLRGWALIEHNQQEAIVQIQQGLTDWQATCAELFRPHLLALLAEAYEKAGQTEAGLDVLEQAFTAAHRSGKRFYEAELHRLKGEFKVHSCEKEAEECFQSAIEIARSQGAKAWELRATTSLSRLWQQQDKSGQAYQTLHPVYSWFNEGHETKDMQEAQLVLRACMPSPTEQQGTQAIQ